MARKPILTKETIVNSALECFLKYGFEETTFTQVALKAKTSQPAIYKHFNHKMDLLSACSLQAAETGRQFIDSQIDPKARASVRFGQYLTANLDFFQKNKKEALAMTALYFFSQTNDDMLQIYHQIQAKSIERFEAALIQISYEKNKKIKDSVELAQIIQSIMVGEIYKNIYRSKPEKNTTTANHLMKYINRLIESSLI